MSIVLHRAESGLRFALVLSCGFAVACAHGTPAPGESTFEARRQIARELVARSDWQNAFGYVDQLHRERPQDADVLVLRAAIYRDRQLMGEAESDLREAIRLAPQLASAQAALGILCDLQRRAAEAEEHHRLAVKLEPENAIYLNNVGFSLFLHGKVKDAIPFYEQAARLQPTSRRVRVNLGFAYAARGDLHRASREFEMGGTPVEARVNLGFAYERRGDLANAYALYQEAVTLDPKSTRARADLAHAALALGRPAPPAAAVAAGIAPGAVEAEIPVRGEEDHHEDGNQEGRTR
jgi:Flp pilus assembly protein TadD